MKKKGIEKQLFIVKESIVFIDLLQNLSRLVQETLQKYHRDISWLQFARYEGPGYRFLDHKTRQWHLLEDIAQKAAAASDGFTIGQTIDILSELVNTTVKETILLHELRLITQLSSKEGVYIEKYRIELIILKQRQKVFSVH